MEINQVYHGFKLKKSSYIKEIASQAYEFEHMKSGAKLLFVANSDDNKVFSITFRTTPTDDTGVAHIVEHSTLCGSRKFPTKEPFVELVKGSLNTFLNAMTFPDKTMYPVASRNDKDFRNLMDVYLDAVFYPNMRNVPEILMQEGWHYEIEDADEPLKYSGVVYNEMKGALSSPDGLLERKILNNLYPDTTYQYESGGDPKAIPDLTQQMFIDFHSRYYHPANSYIYLYGDMDMMDTLAFLDEEYLSAFDKIEIDSHVDLQKPFAARKVLHDVYPVAPHESKANKTFLSLNYSIATSLEKEKMLAFTILEHALLKSEAAPLRNALIKAGLGSDVISSFDNGILQPMFSIIVNGSEADKADEFAKIVNDTLTDIVNKGIDKELLQASINIMEFKLREADFGQYPKGLIYNINLMNSWLYDGDPTMYLYYEDLLAVVKTWAAEGKFEELIKTYLLDNPHSLMLILAPDETIIPNNERALMTKLAEIKAAMNDEQLQEIIAATKALKKRQRSADTPEALAKIPLLKISDINKKCDKLILAEDEIGGSKVLKHDVETNGIAYIKMFFDVSAIAYEDIDYLFLLEEFIGRTATKNYSYEALANAVNLHTGGMRFSVATYDREGDVNSYMPKMVFKAKVLVDKVPKLMELLQEIVFNSSFASKERIKELALQCRSDFEMSILRSGHQLVLDELMAYFTPKERYDNYGDLKFYDFIKKFLNDFDNEFAKMQTVFAKIMPMVFNKHNLITSITIDEKDYGKVADAVAPFIAALPDEAYPPQEIPFSVDKKNEGFITSTQVQYVAKGANFMRLGYKYTGAMKVLETIMRYEYLWTHIRVLGGAYGAFVKFRRDGNMYFGSYRDPNLKETLNVYDNTGAFLRSFAVSDREMTKYIIGTISGMDMPLTPALKGELAASSYIVGMTDEMRQQQRDEVLATTQEDIRSLADLVDACMEENAVCVLGSSSKVNEAQDVFKTVKSIL